MRRCLAVVATASLVLLLLFGTVFAWQGRMAGMGDPFGLIEDESDFLINPAKIADGNGLKFYGNYRFTYGDVTDWKWGARANQLSGPFFGQRDASGNEYNHDALLGAGFPVGPGRLGVFFNYSGKRSDFDGRLQAFDSLNTNFQMNSDFDNFALRLLYGQPLGDNFKIGGELQIAHRDEDNRFQNTFLPPTLASTPIIVTNDFAGDLLPFMIPNDSSFWEILLKMGLEGNFGPTKVGLAVRGGPIVAGDSEWSGRQSGGDSLLPTRFDMNGDTDGWKIGADFWVRHALSQNLSIPLVFKVDFTDRSRSGTGTENNFLSFGNPPFFPITIPITSGLSQSLGFQSSESLLQIEVGGGIDLILSNTGRVAVGIYYDYLKTENDLSVTPAVGGTVFDYTEFPNRTEHLARLKVAWEGQVSPSWTARGGVNFFGGFARESFDSNFVVVPDISFSTFRGSLGGTHWGITGSFGATTRFAGMTLEPFVQAGYQELNLDDNSAQSTFLGGTPPFQWDMDTIRREAIVGAGLSILF